MCNKRVSGLLLLAMVASMVLISACGAQPSPEVIEVEVTTEVITEVSKDVVVTATPVPLAAGGVKIIPFLTTETDPATVDVLMSIFGEFQEANPGVAVDLVLSSTGSELERFVTAKSVGADMGLMPIPLGAVDLINAGYLLPLDDVVEAIGPDDFKPNSLLTYDGHVYGFGWAGGTHGTLWVRKDMFEEAGIAIPTNYEELLAASEALTRDTDGDGKIDVYGIGLPAGSDPATTARFVSFVYQNCGEYFDKQGNLVFDSPGVLEALNRYVALLEYAPPGITGWSWYDGLEAFLAGKIAMHPYGGRLGVNVFSTSPELRDKIAVIPLKVGDKVEAGRGVYDYVGVASTVKFPEEAKALLKFWFTGDRLPRFLLTVPGHLIPPTYSMDEATLGIDNEYMKRYAEDVKVLFESQATNADAVWNMGAVDTKTCTLNATFNPLPWSGCIVGEPPVDAAMIQRVVINGEDPEAAWQWAIDEMKKCADTWKAENPDWKPIE